MNNNYSSIVPQYDIRRIAENMNRSADDIIKRIITRLQYIGEQCIKIAREKGDYNDITGNLRSSIGYVVLLNGAAVKQRIVQPTNVTPGERDVTRTKSDGSQYMAKEHVGGTGRGGRKAAKSLLDKLKTKYPRGCVLIVCAGMNYAAYVENIHGKRVLVDAQLTAERLAYKFFRQNKSL